MKANQRKAKLKRARQHQAHCKASKHQQIKRFKDVNEWASYSRRQAQFKCERSDDGDGKSSLTFKQGVMLTLFWAIGVLGIVWMIGVKA